MAMVMEQQQQAYKYYCRICKKGFGCGRALGGHMRAHGINDDHGTDPDDEPSASGEWDDKLSPTAGGKRMYALRANPNRLKSCRVCENCGEDFRSWKSFLEHGRCRSDDEGEDSIPSSPRSDGGGCAGWSKGKRSRRAAAGKPSPSSEEEDLANCLVMLSSARVDPVVAVVETEESSASASKEEDRRYTIDRTTPAAAPAAAEKGKAPAPAAPRGLFECKACKKVFSSHQALGGHRASHKKVKGCFAARLDYPDEPPPDVELITHDDSEVVVAEMSMAIVPFDNRPPAIAPINKKSKVHECSICHRVFASGQALGGHKRCHWITSNSPDPSLPAKLRPMPDNAGHHQLRLGPIFDPSDPLDLNLPAPASDLALVRDINSPLRLEVPAAAAAAAASMYPWIDLSNNKNSSNNNEGSNGNNVEDEAESKIKLARLSDLKDMKEGGPWLQVGIGSSTNEVGDP